MSLATKRRRRVAVKETLLPVLWELRRREASSRDAGADALGRGAMESAGVAYGAAGALDGMARDLERVIDALVPAQRPDWWTEGQHRVARERQAAFDAASVGEKGAAK